MAVISGTTVNWTVSPRIIKIPVPITEVTIENLQDTLQSIEDDEEGIVWPYLRKMSGGEALGGGTLVGYTMELQNAQLQFEGRTTATEFGAVSSNDTTGTLLNAVGGAFVTNGVSRGDTVFNSTTGSIATILSITDNQNLISQVLSGGARTTWLNTDSYSIYVNVQCSLTGGNLVAVDTASLSISPVLQSANTNVIRSSSSSATIQNQEQLEAASFISDLGVTVSPATGTDGITYPIGVRETPCQTETNVHDILEARGFNKVFIKDSLNLYLDNSEGYNFIGDSPQTVNVNVGDVATYPLKDVTSCQFRYVYLTGELDALNIMWECVIGNITKANGFIYESTILDTIQISDNLSMERCWIAPTATSQECTIDFNGLAKTVIMSQWSAGRVRCSNMVTGSFLGISGTGGRVVPDTSNTGGTVVYAGAVTVDDTFGANLDLLQDTSTAGQVWTNTNGTDALNKITLQDKLLRNKTTTDPVSGVMTVYDDDDSTVLFTANIWENVAGTTAYDGSAINRKDRFT